jgi:sporulation protein YlmC with PRC-barrel domain
MRFMVDLDRKNDWVQWEVMTETGIHLGWVRSVSIDPKNNAQVSLVIVPIAIGWLPQQFVGAYQLANVDLLCVGVDRLLIVAEDAEQKLKQLKVGVLSRKAQSSLNRLPIAIMVWGQSILYLIGIAKPSRWMRRQKTYCAPSRNDNHGWDDPGFQPAIMPRRPSPNPLNQAAEIPLN